MQINIKDSKQIKIVEISGVLDTATSPEAELKINEMLKEGANQLVINLENTSYLSSSGLRVLLATAKKLWTSGGRLKICNPNKVVRDILDTSGFSMILDVRDSEEEALAEF